MSETNGIDAFKANLHVREIEREEEEIISIKMRYLAKIKADCEAHYENIKDWKERAVADGIPKRALSKILKERELLRRIARLDSEVSEDDRDLVDDLRAKLEPVADLPLFGAAIDRAEAEAADKTETAPKPRRTRKSKTDVPDSIPGDVLAGFVGDQLDDTIPGDESDASDAAAQVH